MADMKLLGRLRNGQLFFQIILYVFQNLFQKIFFQICRNCSKFMGCSGDMNQQLGGNPAQTDMPARGSGFRLLDSSGEIAVHIFPFCSGSAKNNCFRRGTVQISVRQGIDYLGAIARSLLRLGFKRQIYFSLHGPAHMTVSPMVPDFYDETGVPILYMDMTMQLFSNARDLFQTDKMTTDPRAFMAILDSMFVGAYQIMGRLEDVPLTTEFSAAVGQSCAPFNDIFNLAYQSGSVGYCFGENSDHAPTTAIPDAETRQRMADEGQVIIEKLVERLNMPHVVEQLRKLEEYGLENEKKYPWMPSAWNKAHGF